MDASLKPPRHEPVAVTMEGVDLSLGTGRARVHILKQISLQIAVGEAVGLVGPIASLGINVLGAPALLPLFHAAPWLATSLFHGFPGIVLGAVALLIAWMIRRPAAEVA